MKTTATKGERTAAPADAETQRHRATPRGTLPERAPHGKRGAAPPLHQNKEQSPQLMSLLKRTRDPARSALFEPDPATAKPKRRRAHKARDVSDDLELGPTRRPATFFEAVCPRAPRADRDRPAPRAGLSQ